MSTLTTITGVEAKLFLRDATAAIMTFALPVGLLAIFGSIGMGEGADAQNVPESFVPVMALSLAVAMLGLSVLPTVLGTYREKGILRRLSVTPVNPVNVLSAQLLVNLGAAVVSSAVVLVLAATAFGLGSPQNIPAFVVGFALTAAALFSIGLLVSALAPSGKSATSIGMLLFFPSMFFAGVWTPGELMPDWAEPVREVSPLGAGMEAMQDAWDGGWGGAANLVALVVAVLVAGSLGARFFRWE
ncbi:ABC-2 type transport system permease protein [Haloactinopolyspora alba]|uniref:Transport permease protein n=1 Tax=Haloactinopolyspora alba TaxID=648780 RepID=A0A2P8E261_9ACTN|nr:ABC transporter permease [Haloactinopolyspora alba]PSL03555.1 ABC-2 type transport system permease protein [Haloactinopolyspora alba]